MGGVANVVDKLVDCEATDAKSLMSSVKRHDLRSSRRRNYGVRESRLLRRYARAHVHPHSHPYVHAAKAKVCGVYDGKWSALRMVCRLSTCENFDDIHQ
eukprot:498964-Pleurochrysis_carterae.AAC.2